jgi:hypothetical protein
MFDSFGDGWNGNVLQIADHEFTLEHGSQTYSKLKHVLHN